MALDPRDAISGIQRRELGTRDDLSDRDRNRALRAQRQSIIQGGGGRSFSNIDAILGTQRGAFGLSSQTLRGPGDKLRSLADIAGQGDTTLSDDDRNTLTSFFDPTVNKQQERQLTGLAKRATSQGLFGKAIGGQLKNLHSRFVAGNRAQAFGGVQDIIGARLNQLQEETDPFLRLVGNLRSGSQFDVLTAGGITTGEFKQFAGTALRGLSAVGLGADALAGIARGQGLAFDQAGLTGAGDVSQAFQQFLKPGTQAFGQFLQNQGVQVRRNQQGQFFGSAPGGLNTARAQNRLGAAEHLAGRVGQFVQGVGSEATALSALGQVSINAFTLTGDQGAANRLASADFSQFSGLTRALGLGQGTRTAQGRAGATSGTSFLAGNNPLFNTVFGR